MENQRVIEWEKIKNEVRPKVRYWLPAAAMDKEDLRKELENLKERGFGGVEIVTLSSIPMEIATGEDGWGTEHWNETVDFIAAVTKELGMSLDIANGPSWPIAMPSIKSADDPAALRELTYGVVACDKGGHFCGDVPKRRVIHEEGTSELLHVMAYIEASQKVLKQSSYQNLMGCLNEEKTMIDCTLPDIDEGERWLIFAFYVQPSVQKSGNGQYYVIDHLSKVGTKACEKYWDEILTQTEKYSSMESIFCDSLEYQVMMEWTMGFDFFFEKEMGYSILPYLPIVKKTVFYPETDIPGYIFEDSIISDQINNDYFEMLTRCYCENHLAEFEKVAEKHGKTVRYQVAYNKPFEGERCPLYVGIPENEALGRPAIDFQKFMAAAAHLGRKKRYSFECAAIFGNAYGQTYDDLFWWVKRSLMAGMNAQVLHGASYSGSYHGKYAVDGSMEGVKWPGYEGFGKAISNYWNRTLSVEDARNVLDAIARLNTLFLKKAKVDCAIYRQSYYNDGLGSEFCLYQDGGKLANQGYTYEFVSPYLLNIPASKVTDGVLDKEGVGYKSLIIPEQQEISLEFLIRLEELLDEGLSVFWIGEKPVHAIHYHEWRNEERKESWKKHLDNIWNHKKLIHVSAIEDMPECLKQAGILPNICLDGTKDIMTAMHVDEENKKKYCAFYGYNRVVYSPDDPNPDEILCSGLYKKGTTKGSYKRAGRKSRKTIQVKIVGEGIVYKWNYWTGKAEELSFEKQGDYMCGSVTIEEDEMVILALDENGKKEDINCEKVQEEKSNEIPVEFESLNLYKFGPATSTEKSFLRSAFSKESVCYDENILRPWIEIDSKLKKFAGKGIYKGNIKLIQKDLRKKYVLYLGNVQDTFRVWINDKLVEGADQVLKKVEITEFLQEGDNAIMVEVVSNLYNCLQGTGEKDVVPFQVPYVEKDYGIWEEGEERCVVREE